MVTQTAKRDGSATGLDGLYPFTGRYFDLDGLAYHYLDEGSGPPVLMLHGNPTWSFYYRNLVLALRDRFRCIVPDHIGCGLSDKPGEDRYHYTLATRVSDLERLIEHLDIKEPITLVVHDWGGMIGMAFAVRNPEKIARLVIMNTAAFHLPAEKRLPLALKICRNNPVGDVLIRGFNAFSLAASIVGCKRHPMSGELRRAYRRPYDSWKNRIATLRFVQDIPLAPGQRNYSLVALVAAGLEQFRGIPKLVLWGEKDFVFDRHFLEEWKRRFPDAEVHSYPDAGHYVLEDAAEDAIPRIVDFLERTTGSGCAG